MNTRYKVPMGVVVATCLVAAAVRLLTGCTVKPEMHEHIDEGAIQVPNCKVAVAPTVYLPQPCPPPPPPQIPCACVCNEGGLDARVD